MASVDSRIVTAPENITNKSSKPKEKQLVALFLDDTLTTLAL
jgi:hypothetical protein